jgi:hypothetical protein
MNTFEPNNPPSPDPFGEPNTVTECAESVDFYFDGPGDTTVRPRRPEVPRFWPADIPLPPPSDESCKPKQS